MEKFIEGFDQKYKIYDDGRVYSLKSHKFLKQITSPQGYKYVNLSKDGIFKHYYIHVLVAEYFIDKNINKLLVHHVDCDKTNNIFSNLKYVSNQENIQEASKDNLLAFGEKNTASKLTSLEVEEIKSSSLSSRELGKFYNVSHVTILNIKNEKYRTKG